MHESVGPWWRWTSARRVRRHAACAAPGSVPDARACKRTAASRRVSVCTWFAVLARSVVSRRRSRPSSSRRSGVTSSAAAEGVGARWSATKSAMVTSVSPDGGYHRNPGRRDRSRHRLEIDAARSSSEPPPRVSTTTSGGWRMNSARSNAVTICPCASKPCTATWNQVTRTHGKRRRMTARTSLRAAPAGELMMPTWRGTAAAAACGPRRTGPRRRASPSVARSPPAARPRPRVRCGRRSPGTAHGLRRWTVGMYQDRLAVDRLGTHETVGVREHHAADLRPVVLQAEVPVSGSVGPEVGDLPLDPQPPETFLDQEPGFPFTSLTIRTRSALCERDWLRGCIGAV